MDEKVPRRLRTEGRAKDVFCLVKGSMSDTTLSQPPILVYPDVFRPATESFINKINSCRSVLTASLDDGRKEELTSLGKCILEDFPHLRRGVEYLKTLTNDDRRREQCPILKFIEAGPSCSNNLGNLRADPQRFPPKPHKLQVVFHH